MADRMRIANTVASALAAFVVFVVAGGLAFTAFASLVWAFSANIPLSYFAGAVVGILTGGLVATPFVQRVLRLRRGSAGRWLGGTHMFIRVRERRVFGSPRGPGPTT